MLNELWPTRKKLEKVFSQDTAAPGTNSDIPSAGHCAAVSYLIWSIFGGEMVSTKVNGQSHWFNRIGDIDIDLTGDQFNRAPMQIADNSKLWPDTRLRNFGDLNQETLDRAQVLAKRAGYDIAPRFARRMD